jgi:phage-related protein
MNQLRIRVSGRQGGDSMNDILSQLGVTPESVSSGISDIFSSISSNLGPGVAQTISGDLSGGISSIMGGVGTLAAQLTKKSINSIATVTGKTLGTVVKKTWSSVNSIMGVGVSLLSKTLTTGTDSAMYTLKSTMIDMKNWWDNQAQDTAKLTGVTLADMEAAVNDYAASMKSQGLSSLIDADSFKNSLTQAVQEGMSFDQAKVAAEQAAVLESHMGGLGDAMLPTFNRLLADAKSMQLGGEEAIAYAKEQTQLVADAVYANQKEFGYAISAYSKSSEALLSSASTLGIDNMGQMIASLSGMDAVLHDLAPGIGASMSDIVAQIATGKQTDMVPLITSMGIGATNQQEFLQRLSEDSAGTIGALMDTLTKFTASGAYGVDAMADIFGVNTETMRTLAGNGNAMLKTFQDSNANLGLDTLAENVALLGQQTSDSSKINNATANQVMLNFSGNAANLQVETVTAVEGVAETIKGPMGLLVGTLLKLAMVGPEAATAIVTQIQNMVVELPGIIGNLVNGVQDIIPVLVGLVPQIVATLASSIPEIFSTLANLLPVLIDGISQSLLIIGQQLPVILPPILDTALDVVFSTFPQTLNLVFTNILPVLGKLVLDVVHSLPGTLRELASNMPEPWGTLFNSVATLVEMLTPALDSIVAAVLDLIPVIINIVTSLLPVLSKIIETVMAIVTPIIEPIVQLVSAFADNLVPIISQLIEAILPAVVGILDFLIPIVTQIMGALAPLLTVTLQVLGPVLSAVFEVMNTIFTPILSFVGEGITYVGGLIDNLVSKWTKDKEDSSTEDKGTTYQPIEIKPIEIDIPETEPMTPKVTPIQPITPSSVNRIAANPELVDELTSLSTNISRLTESVVNIEQTVVIIHPLLASMLESVQSLNVAPTTPDTIQFNPGDSDLELIAAIQDIELTLPVEFIESQLAYQAKVLDKFDLTIKELKEISSLLRPNKSTPSTVPVMGNKPNNTIPVGSGAILRR